MPSGCFPHRCVRTPKTSWPPRCWLAVSLASTFNSVFIKNLSLRNTKYWIRSTKSTRDHDGLYWTINRRRGYSTIHLDRSCFDVCKGQGVGEWPCTARAWGTEHRTAGEARWAPENQRGRRAPKRNSFPARAALGRCLPSASRTKTIRNVLTGYESDCVQPARRFLVWIAELIRLPDAQFMCVPRTVVCRPHVFRRKHFSCSVSWGDVRLTF